MRKPHSIALGVLTAMGLSVAVAHAAPTVVQSAGFATEVDNLVVGGVSYTVTFGLTIDQTFQGDPTGALAAANALVDALNGSPAVNTDIPGVETSNGFTVAENQDSGPGGIDGPALVGQWVETNTGGAPFAEFAVPEPATFTLLVAGLVALGAARRRSR